VLASVRWKPLRWAGPAILGIAGVAAWSGQLDQLMSKLLQSDSVGDFAIRAEIWSRAAQAIHDYPLTGIGMGAFRSVVPSLYPYILSDPAKVHHAHNLYLQVGADLGLPGLVSFAALALCLAALGYLGRRRWAAAGNPRMSWLAAGCLGGLAAMLTHGLLDALTWGTKPAFLAWAVLGLLLATALTAFSSSTTRQV
jgi:putative inorganic carbon (HCO3(-)) transporter